MVYIGIVQQVEFKFKIPKSIQYIQMVCNQEIEPSLQFPLYDPIKDHSVWEMIK
jgi:hypothetical protein